VALLDKALLVVQRTKQRSSRFIESYFPVFFGLWQL
jgi:hypothetical protein